MALIVAGIAVADFFIPVTLIPWMNWVSTSSVALAAILLIIASVRELGAGNALPAHSRPPSVGAPSLDTPGAMYVFSWHVPPFRRLSLIVLGLYLGVNLVPGAWILLQMFGLYLPGSHPQFIADTPATFIVRTFLTLSLALVGITGLGLGIGWDDRENWSCSGKQGWTDDQEREASAVDPVGEDTGYLVGHWQPGTA